MDTGERIKTPYGLQLKFVMPTVPGPIGTTPEQEDVRKGMDLIIHLKDNSKVSLPIIRFTVITSSNLFE